MAKLAIKKASTDVTTYVFIQDSSKTTGEGLAGLAYNTGSLVGYYVRPKGSATAITLATQTVTGDHSDGGFVEIDATNMPGVYRLDLPDAVCATGVPSVVVMLKGATDMSPVVLEIQLTDFDLNTAAITAAAVADAVWDEATADHTTSTTFGAVKTDTAAILADTGTDGVKIASAQTVATVTNLTNLPTMPTDWITAAGLKADAVTEIQDGVTLANTQPAITWGQQKIIADVEDEGALHIVNTNDEGIGQANIGGGAGVRNYGQYAYGVWNVSDGGDGMRNEGVDNGMYNKGKTGLNNYSNTTNGFGMQNQGLGSGGIGVSSSGTSKNVNGFDPLQATEATLTAMKGAGWTTQTLVALKTAIDNITGGGATAQQIWEYTTRTITGLPAMPTDWVTAAGLKADAVTEIQAGLATSANLQTVDDNVDAIKAKTDNIPASPAAVGSAMTLTAAYDKAKDDVLTPLGVVDGIVDAIKVQTDKIPATPASAGEYTANIGAIKAKTDNLPLSPASSGEYTSALTAIQNDLDNPNQYKADVSNLALQATSLAIKGQTDKIPAAPAQTGEYNAALTAIQADLDNPTQYKADISGLATKEDVESVSVLGEVIVGDYDIQDAFKIILAKLVGLATGGETTTITYKGIDGANNVIVETVDGKGNRSNVTLAV